MPLVLDAEAGQARDLAKRCVPEGGELDALTWLRALAQAGSLKQRLPANVAAALPPLEPRLAAPPARVAVAKSLQPVLNKLADTYAEVSAQQLFLALLDDPAVQSELAARGLAPAAVAALVQALPAGGADPGEETTPAQRVSPARRQAADALSSFGRMLTLTAPPDRHVHGMDATVRELVTTLSKMGNRSAIVTGPAGVGKSAVVYELARRIVRGDRSIPPRLRELDLFELSPSFLRSGASFVGQYDERIKSLLQVLDRNRNIVVFIDEIHSFLKSGMQERDAYTDANESLKGRIASGQLVVLGCTTTAEYRHYIEPDPAWHSRFRQIKLEPPDAAATVNILQARRPRMEEYFAPLRLPDAILARTVALTDLYLPGQFQPRKSIQVLDEACAICVTAEPPPAEVTEDALMQALETRIGKSVVRKGAITEQAVLRRLQQKIVGQDACLAGIGNRFVAGLGDWFAGTRPRGVWFFCGPTGVGKTECATVLAEILGGGADALVRINCNVLQGSGLDSGPAINTLLGAPPGYLGYVRGQGGLLSKVRDKPESIVLFDEIEKADPGVAKLLLQIMDNGYTDDNEGNRLDFRRAYLVFTTNAGSNYGETRRAIGFPAATQATDEPLPLAIDDVRAALRAIGYGEEFLGRVEHFFVFEAMKRETVGLIVANELAKLRAGAAARGLELEWDPALIETLLAAWRPRFGARHLLAIVRNRIVGQLAVAQAEGGLEGVRTIRLRAPGSFAAADNDVPAGAATRRREGDVLLINVS